MCLSAYAINVSKYHWITAKFMLVNDTIARYVFNMIFETYLAILPRQTEN